MEKLSHNSTRGTTRLCAPTVARGELGLSHAPTMHVSDGITLDYPKGQQQGRWDEASNALRAMPILLSDDCTGTEGFSFQAGEGGSCNQGIRSSPARHQHQEQDGISGPMYFPSDILDNAEGSFQDAGTEGPAAECPHEGSAPCRRTTPVREKVTVRVASWNLAGVSTKAVETIIANVVECDVIAVQEFPKQIAGWKILTGEKYNGMIHQNYCMYRGVGILYRKDRFHLLKKSSSQRGMWLLLRHSKTQQKMAVGCVHLPNNEGKEETARVLAEFLKAKPRGGQPELVLGDFNVQFSWREADSKVVPGIVTAKWGALRQGMAEAGLQQAVPMKPQMHLATFHSRKNTVKSTQIDGAFASGQDVMQIVIKEGSRLEVGTDHDRVEMDVGLPGGGTSVGKKNRGGGPRVVVSEPPPQQHISQHCLKQLACKHTRPLSLGPSFRPSPATTVLKEMAKEGQTAEAWKTYRVALRKEKAQWRETRIEKACADWRLYKALTKPKKQWGEQYMASADTEDPVGQIKEHFESIFHGKEAEEEMKQMEDLMSKLGGGRDTEPFTEEEVARAIGKGKRGKAVGPDGVSTELLQALTRDPVSLLAVTEFFNGILSTGETPTDWDRSIATLLPKVNPPLCPKDLRPIALASHVSKAFARLVLARLEDVLMIKGDKQFAAKGRQPAEFLWTAIQVVHLAKEWKSDAYILKLDIRKAFDTVSRLRLAKKVIQWADGRFAAEVKCLLRMLMSREVVLALPWGEHAIDANIGVKQGATESPLLFAKLLDDILSDIRQKHVGPVLEDIPTDGACFMDDVITWKASVATLQSFMNKLLPSLAMYGLHIQPAKCVLMCIQGSKTTPLMLDGMPLFPQKGEDVVYIMNLPVGPESTEARIMEHLVDRARKKYFGILHLLQSRASLGCRIKLLNTVVFGVFRWVVGALFPTPQLQNILNYFQYNCIRRMMKIGRQEKELWVDFEARSLRLARAMVFKHDGKRWGDRHVEAHWEFVGHRSRGNEREWPSAANKLTWYRGLPWWQQEQQRQAGRRHGRHFPHLMNCERRVSHTVSTTAWREKTLNRAEWANYKEAWCQQNQVAWASGRQPSLMNME